MKNNYNRLTSQPIVIQMRLNDLMFDKFETDLIDENVIQ